MNAQNPFNKLAFESLYEKIGKEAGLQAILRDFYGRMAKDPMIGFFFQGKDANEIADRQKEFLSRAMGAHSSYAGRPPADAHEKLAPILPGHFDRRLRLLEETLTDHGLADEDIRNWISFENSFRPGIIGKPSKILSQEP